MARRVTDKQGALPFTSWGGARRGAGRPRALGAKLRHAPRPRVSPHHPVLVTLRAAPGSPNLRRSSCFAAIERALRAAKERAGFGVVHFTTQTNHLHLVVEARDADALSRGMQGLAIGVARGVNRAAGRRGKLWADRFHARALRSPREVRNAICYVVQNTRRHATTERELVDPGWIDPRSSGPWFDGWRGAPDRPEPTGDPPTSQPRTWLLSRGWRRSGLIRVDEVPAAAFTAPSARKRGR
jgi:REP element-mobilizing transposase RayT